MTHTTWQQNYDRFTAVVAEHGALPRFRTDDTTEKQTVTWLHMQRHAHRTGTLPAEREAALDDWSRKTGIDWRDMRHHRLDTDWTRRFEEFTAYVAARGELPRFRTGDAEERSAYGWLDRQREHRRRGTLTPDREAALDEWGHTTGHDWRADRETRWTRQCQALRSFVADHGRLPSRRATGTERRVADWLDGQRKLLRTGTLPAEREAVLDADSHESGVEWRGSRG